MSQFPAEEQRMNLNFCKSAIFRAAIRLILPAGPILLAAQPALAQTINPFAGNQDDPQHEVWRRIAIPPDHPVSNVAQWHTDYAKFQIVCDGNGGHEWLRFNHEFSNFTFHVKWRFTPVTTAEPKYNSGVFFRNNLEVPSGTKRRHRSAAATSSASRQSKASRRASTCKKR
jgi:Domain of Unknown Function (DUF1080)